MGVTNERSWTGKWWFNNQNGVSAPRNVSNGTKTVTASNQKQAIALMKSQLSSQLFGKPEMAEHFRIRILSVRN